jgi:hypothetical protein
MEEIWKQAYSGGVICPGYEVSNLGNVRSFRKLTRISGVKGTVAYIGTEPRLLKKINLTAGYYGVHLVVGNQIKQRGIAPLVLEAFVGLKPDGMG